MDVEGIVINRTKFRDYDLIVSILTPKSIVSFLARGVLRLESKNASMLLPLTRANFTLMRGKDGLFLKNGKIIEEVSHFGSFLRLSITEFILEITNKLIGSEDASKIYPFLMKTLSAFKDIQNEPYSLALSYFAKVLKVAGYGLNVDECVRCQNKNDIIGVNYSSGGFVCKNCYLENETKKYSKRELEILRFIFKVDINRYLSVSFSKEESYKILLDLAEFAENYAGFRLISLDLFKKI